MVAMRYVTTIKSSFTRLLFRSTTRAINSAGTCTGDFEYVDNNALNNRVTMSRLRYANNLNPGFAFSVERELPAAIRNVFYSFLFFRSISCLVDNLDTEMI